MSRFKFWFKIFQIVQLQCRISIHDQLPSVSSMSIELISSFYLLLQSAGTSSTTFEQLNRLPPRPRFFTPLLSRCWTVNLFQPPITISSFETLDLNIDQSRYFTSDSNQPRCFSGRKKVSFGTSKLGVSCTMQFRPSPASTVLSQFEELTVSSSQLPAPDQVLIRKLVFSIFNASIRALISLYTPDVHAQHLQPQVLPFTSSLCHLRLWKSVSQSLSLAQYIHFTPNSNAAALSTQTPQVVDAPSSIAHISVLNILRNTHKWTDERYKISRKTKSRTTNTTCNSF